ncbi:MerR family transcriptional regulator [Saccharothrix sp. AJ9571]|nr:MerR family transcriptional regulator [Saccharothrix sp. AJ9571]
MIPISEFGHLSHLPPQTLRFYHSEGLLVPAEVDERTGYRSYTFDQLERAMLITVLRGTGMSVKQVRRALDEPDQAAGLLRQHVAEIQRVRQAQDEAIRDGLEFLTSEPQARRRHVPEMTVVSTLVPGPAAEYQRYDWEAADTATAASVASVTRAVESCGATVSGTPWRTWAIETPGQKERSVTLEGPHWLVKVPVTGDEEALAELPGNFEVQTFGAREELSIFIPGRSSMAKFGTAFSRLVTHRLDAAFLDISSMRQVLHDDGVETSTAIRALDGSDAAP